MNAKANVDPEEIARFAKLSAHWWDPAGDCRPLHDMNPMRTDYIAARISLEGARIADVGCGGGLLSEALAGRGAAVTGIDAAAETIAVAKTHAAESGLAIDYRQTTAEALARELPGAFDAVTCLELIEHVPDPASLVRACATLVRPGGAVFFSTVNRTPKSFLFAIVGAEYVLRLLPRGTHDFSRFVRPSELEAWTRHAGLALHDLSGIDYDPFGHRCTPSSSLDVNYLAHATREAA